MSRKKFAALCAVSVLALLVATPALAQTQSDEIIVTATKRATSIQDVPFSVNAQTEADIQRSGATTLEELSRNVAGLNIQNLGPGQSQVAIRGVSAGQIVRDQPGVKEQVGIYLDESVISLSLFTPDLDLFDLNRVETLRGPQGTLFGSGSVGGTIRYITNQPDPSQLEGMLEASLNSVTDGEMGGHLKGMVNIPIGEHAALRIVGYDTEYGGFIDALREGGAIDEDVNSGSRQGVRVSMLVQPTPNLSITPRVVYQNAHADGFNREERFNLFAQPFTTTRPPVQLGERQQFLMLDEEFDDETLLADLTVALTLDNVDVTSISSFISRDILVSRDATALTGSVSISPLGPAGFPELSALLPSNLRDTTDLNQFSQEVRLNSNTEGPFQWLAGVFYTHIDRVYAQRLPTPGYDDVTDTALGAGTSAAVDNGFGLVDNPYHADLPYDIDQFAVFAEASYDVTSELTATVGARYYDFEENRRFHSGGLFSNGDDRIDTTESDGISPRVLLSYDLTDEWTLNAQASKGFRLGGANDPLNIPICDPLTEDAATFGNHPTYQDETLWNYEAGAKYFGRGLSFAGAVYHTEIENLQVTADAGSCSSRVVFNVPEAHTTGLELELTATPIEGLELSIAGSFVESEFDSSVTSPSGAVIAGIREGNRLPSVPDYQIAATAAYYWPISWGEDSEAFVAGSVQHIGSRFTQPGDQEPGVGTFVSRLPFAGASGNDATVLDLELPAYTTLNLNAGVESGNWTAIVFVNNVTDENGLLAFDRERGGRARLGFHVTNPRTIGITLRRRF